MVLRWRSVCDTDASRDSPLPHNLDYRSGEVMPVTVTKDRTAAVVSALQELVRTRVLVGIPENTAARKDGSVSNAQLAYWFENGTQTMPARPSFVPGVQAA